MNVARAICGLTIVVLHVSVAAQPASDLDRYQRLEEMHHTAWTGKDGLIGRLDSLAQTVDGYMWIGTSNGLLRFDGIEFERFAPEPGRLPGADVDALFASRDGGLWVGYVGGGVSYIGRDGRIQNYGREHGLPVGNIRALAEDHDGVMWAAAVGGLARFEAGRWHIVRMDWNYPCRSAMRIFVGRDGTLWVGGTSPERTLYLRKGSRRFEDLGLTASIWGFVQVDDSTVLLTDPENSATLREGRRQADGTYRSRDITGGSDHPMVADGDGGVWFLSARGVSRRRLPIAPGPVSNVSGSDVERVALEDGLSGRVSNDLLIDREGTVWSVTDTGLDRFRRRNLTWKRDLRVDGGASLVAGKDGSVWAIGPSQSRPWRTDDDSVGPAGAAEPDRGYLAPDGVIWLNGGGSFLRWNNGRLEAQAPPDEILRRGYRFNVNTAVWDRQGRLWASVSGLGQFYLKDSRWTFVSILPGRADLTAAKAHVDVADRVWLAYITEVARVHRDTVRVFSEADGLALGPILALTSRDASLWLGAEMGLAFEKNERFHTVRTHDGREFGGVADIVPTRNGLWLSAAIGIVHIPDSEIRQVTNDPSHRVRYDLFDLVSDLPEPLVARRRYLTATEGRDGILWFLTNTGIARVDPRLIVRNSVVPPVAIRAVTGDDKAYQPGNVVSLPALTRTLQIDYTALSLAIPERVRFRHRLEGWHTDWHEAGTRRTASYTDLKPGPYTFRVTAANNDGVWNEQGATLAFTVAPAWFQTLWFQGLIVMSVVGATIGLYQLRLRRVSRAMSARYEERLAERTRIARELHDTLLQTVQGSKIVADDALDHSADPEHVHRALARLAEWLGQAVHEGRAALNSLRAPAAHTNDLVEALNRAADDPTKPTDMSVSVVVQGNARDLHPIAHDEIYRIAHEAIRNSYKHSRATRLDISIEYGRHELRLRVADNGGGIDPALAERGRPGGFGIPGMRERAKRIGGSLAIASSSSGTALTLSVPGRSAFRLAGAPDHSL